MIRDDVADIRRYIVELRELLADGASGGPGGGGKVIDSPAPWNDTVGELLTDIHAGARRLARQFAPFIGQPMPALGAVDAGTMKALDFVGSVHERMRENGWVGTAYYGEIMVEAEAEVHGWAVRARTELGIPRTGEAGWSKAPGLRCPNPGCGDFLWLPPGWVTQPAPSVHCLTERDPETGAVPTWTFQEWHRLVA